MTTIPVEMGRQSEMQSAAMSLPEVRQPVLLEKVNQIVGKVGRLATKAIFGPGHDRNIDFMSEHFGHSEKRNQLVPDSYSDQWVGFRAEDI
jgi:hypothetical protein